MRRLADRVVNWLLRHAPWYHPEEIEAREQHTEAVRQESIAVRRDAEDAAAGRPSRLDSYRRARFSR